MKDWAVGDVEDLEARLLGGPRRYTRVDIAKRTGVSGAQPRAYWRALGFADVADESVAFTDSDMDALKRVLRLVQEGVVDAELAQGLIRSVGHTMTRLCEWQVTAMFE